MRWGVFLSLQTEVRGKEQGQRALLFWLGREDHPERLRRAIFLASESGPLALNFSSLRNCARG